MNILLDTNILIWFLENSQKLKPEIIEIIEEEKNSVFVSIVSFFEITIKLKIEKLKLSDSLKKVFETTEKSDIKILELDKKHILQYEDLEFDDDHKDPFDRLLISIAIQEKLTIISSDQKFKNYKHILNLIEA